MARNSGDRTCVRNVNITDTGISNSQAHNEREKNSYVNPDIVPERSTLNVHYKTPSDDYTKLFGQMEAQKTISTRGLKPDAIKFCELVFDVNSAYFYNHGGYAYARQFYEEAYRAAIKIVGGEQYILSAVMHADERNRAMSEKLGEDVYHYHLHVVYVPVVEKQILWSKRCKDPALRGTVKEVITQVSHSKKWASKPALDDLGEPILNSNGKTVLRKSYSVLQDNYYQHMIAAGYTDLERGEYGSTEEHLTVTQFKVQQEQKRLEQIQEAGEYALEETERLNLELQAAEAQTEAARWQLHDVAPKLKNAQEFAKKYLGSPEELLPEAGALESGKTYRDKKAMPLVERLTVALRGLYRAYLDLKQKFERLTEKCQRLEDRNETLRSTVERLQLENTELKQDAASYNALCRGYGLDVIAKRVKTITEQEAAGRVHLRASHRRYEAEAR